MSSSKTQWPWSVLGLDGPTDNNRLVRRAYASKLKEIDQELDLEGFEALREAFEFAKRASGETNRHNTLRALGEARTSEDERPPTHSDRESLETPATANPFEAIQSQEENSQEAEKPTPVGPWQTRDFSDPNFVLKQAYALFESENLQSKDWLPIINAPALNEFGVYREMEHLLVEFLTRRSNDTFLPDLLEAEFCAALDARFGWASDGVGFLQKFPRSRELQTDVADIVRRSNRMSNPQAFAKKQDTETKPIPPLLWVLPVIAWLFLLKI